MAKKKKKGSAQTKPMSPERYIRERVRLLPIDKCYVNADWKESGLADILVIRRHSTGKFTMAAFLVDIFCRGVYDSLYKFNIDEEELEGILDMFAVHDMEEVEYVEAHNIIFGAIEFAEEAGIRPCDDFALTRYMLEEDTDDVPLIEYDFGKDGKHWLFVHSNFEASKYLPAMKKNLGDNYDVTIADDDEFEDDDEDTDEDEETSSIFDTGMESEYSYQHPEYPSQIELKHQWVQDLLTTPEKEILTSEEIDKILSLPHDELRHDLEQMALFEMGRNARGEYSDPYNPVIGHVLLLLGAIGDERSLDTVFEIMRQDEDFFEYHICDGAAYLLNPALYQLAKHDLRRLLKYAEEPGLHSYFRTEALNVMTTMAVQFEPERRDEVLGYADEFISFLISHADDPKYMDGTVAGAVCGELIDLNATELLPDIEALYATGAVAIGFCGTLASVKRDIQRKHRLDAPEPFDIHKLYKDMDRVFKH